MHLGRQVVDQQHQRLVDGLGDNDVVIVQDQHDRPVQRRAAGDRVDEQGEHELNEGRRRGEHGACRRDQAGVDRRDRGEHIAPEADRIVVAGIQGDPGGVERRRRPGSAVGAIVRLPVGSVCGEPLGQQRRFAGASGGTDERELAAMLEGLIKAGDEARTTDPRGGHRRWVELRGEQQDGHGRASPLRVRMPPL